MEKYGAKDEHLIESLRNEEARLMQEVSRMMTEKTASQSLSNVEARLQSVRQKITEFDLGKK